MSKVNRYRFLDDKKFMDEFHKIAGSFDYRGGSAVEEWEEWKQEAERRRALMEKRLPKKPLPKDRI